MPQLPPLSIHYYALTYRALQPATFPPFAGSMLRGKFGDIIQSEETAKRIKTLKEGRLSELLFERQLPPEHPWHVSHKKPQLLCPNCGVYPPKEAFTDYTKAPSPFLFRIGARQPLKFRAGDTFTFTFVLFGTYHKYFRYLLPVFEKMGAAGLGYDDTPFELVNAEVLNEKPEWVSIWGVDNKRILNKSVPLHSEMFAEEKLISPGIEIQFETQTALSKNQQFKGLPSFHALIVSLARRQTMLSNLYEGQPFSWTENEFHDAEKVYSSMYRLHWRRDKRNKKTPVEGYVGTIRFEGDKHIINKYLPLLLLGQHMHVGRNTVYGGGQYTCAYERN